MAEAWGMARVALEADLDRRGEMHSRMWETREAKARRLGIVDGPGRRARLRRGFRGDVVGTAPAIAVLDLLLD
jgi:hypothetical protein